MRQAPAGDGHRAARLHRRPAAPLQASGARAHASRAQGRRHSLVHHRRRNRRARRAAPRRHGPVTALILPLTEAAAHFPPRGALIGLDLGTKTIGVAVSDPDRKLAAGVTTIARTAFTADAKALLALAAERAATGFVLGLPVNMDGSEGPRAQSTRAFARNFAKLTDLPIALWDERLSTAAVERGLIANDVSRARRAEVIDEHAAIFILQGALDRLANLKA